jgi:16S rRNA (cytosine1402-N4)-methyltransferase
MAPPKHISVLLPELVAGLAVVPGGRYVDCTIGAGGHAEAVLRAAQPGGRLLGLDADPAALGLAAGRLSEFGGAAVLVHANFSHLAETASDHRFTAVQGVYFDLGVSSMQLDTPERGFSFQHEAPLDMRFSPDQARSAAELVNEAPEAEIARILYRYGEEPRSRAVARRIVASRPIETTTQLAEVVRQALPGPHQRIHPATRVFQAIRIWVNDELEALESALEQAAGLLAPGGRIGVISFHSLEDRIVKEYFQRESRDCICPPRLPACICGHQASLRLVNRQVIIPSAGEQQENPRSRSAKLRIAEKLGPHRPADASRRTSRQGGRPAAGG